MIECFSFSLFSEDDDYASDEADFSDEIASDDDFSGSDIGSLDGGHAFSDIETKSRFTSYSMTSSVIRRNEGLTLLDERFEKVHISLVHQPTDLLFTVQC